TPFELLDRRFCLVVWRGRLGRLLATEAAELVVIDELGDGWVVPAQGAPGIAADFELLKRHLERIVQQEPADERRPLTQDQFDRLGRLDAADETGKDPQHAALGTTGHFTGRRRLWVQTAIAGPVRWMEH